MKRRTFRVSAGRSGELGSAVAGELGLPPSDAQTLVRNGAVYLGGRRRVDPLQAVKAGDVVSVVLEEAGRSALGQARMPAVQVLREGRHFLAVAKPPGVTTQPSAGRVGESLADAVSAHLGRPAGLVHRLDRDTSGVVLFGKDAPGTSALAALFRRGEVRKRYLAVTGPGLPAAGEIDLPLSKDPKRLGRFRATRAAHGVSALTRYERLYAGAFCLVRLEPRTGRTHQLRAHLSALGAPIAGDSLYGGAVELGGQAAPRCLLHAGSLRFPWEGGTCEVVCPLPADLQRFFDAAGVDPGEER